MKTTQPKPASYAHRETQSHLPAGDSASGATMQPPGVAQFHGLSRVANGSNRVAQLQQYQQLANQRKPALRPKASAGVIQGYFKYRSKPWNDKAAIDHIKAWLNLQGEDGNAFEALALDKADKGALTSYLSSIGVKQSISAILKEDVGGMHEEFKGYDSDDEAMMSDGEDQELYRAKTKSSSTVTLHSLHSTVEQARVSIREMRSGKKLTNPNPTIMAIGDQYFEYTPTPARKDFGISKMRPTEDNTGLQRSGSPKTYADLGKELDKDAKRCKLDMATMNKYIQALLFVNHNATTKDLPGTDEECLSNLRELVAILGLDYARSHNALKVIQQEFLDNTNSFTARLGALNKSPEYGGARSKKLNHPTGGVEYLRTFDEE